MARLASIDNIVGIKDEAGINPTQVTDFFLATEKVDPNFVIFNGDDVMLLPTIVQGAMGIVSGGAHIFGHEIRAIFDAFAKGENEKAKSCSFRFTGSASPAARMEGCFPTLF